jgi:hypothetical protein
VFDSCDGIKLVPQRIVDACQVVCGEVHRFNARRLSFCDPGLCEHGIESLGDRFRC